MSAIAGCTRPGARADVEGMLARIAHRGPAGRAIHETDAGTLGMAWTRAQAASSRILETEQTAQDHARTGRLAQATIKADGLFLTRDLPGIAPLYFARTRDGTLYFASEVKALLSFSRDIRCLPPGHHYDGTKLRAFSRLEPQPALVAEPQAIARELGSRLADAVQQALDGNEVGCWLSGGLDSSAMAALARRQVNTLHTFAGGLAGAPDLEYARQVARYIGSKHHEITVSFDQMLAILPTVIYHLESFDAPLVRSSIINYLVGRAAADYVPAVLSGEGGDELFAGYAYLKQVAPAALADELLDITQRLHNTALQRVDRCSAAHGILAHVPFLAPQVIDYALRIPVALKLHENTEKWILRQALADLLPLAILNRPKAKFWAGAGVGDLLTQYAEARIGDDEFEQERTLPNGWVLHSKEELMYYRIFREHFELADLSWMGRTKGGPQT